MITSSIPQASSGVSGAKPPASPVTRVAAPSREAAPVQKPLQALPSGPPSGRPSPRGSLLDLSV